MVMVVVMVVIYGIGGGDDTGGGDVNCGDDGEGGGRSDDGKDDDEVPSIYCFRWSRPPLPHTAGIFCAKVLPALAACACAGQAGGAFVLLSPFVHPLFFLTPPLLFRYFAAINSTQFFLADPTNGTHGSSAVPVHVLFFFSEPFISFITLRGALHPPHPQIRRTCCFFTPNVFYP